MKQTTFISLLLLLVVSANSCSKEKDPVTTDDTLAATYSVTETWMENNKQLTKPAYIMLVEPSSIDKNTIIMINFGNYGVGVSAEAKVSGNKIDLAKQTLSNLKSVSGTGTMSDTELSFTYSETNGNVTIEVTATGTKR